MVKETVLGLMLLLMQPTFIDLTLNNGVRVVAVVRPNLPYAVAGLWLKVGSAADGIGKEGTAHLLEHLVPLRQWNDTTVQIAIERMGGLLVPETGRDFMAFQIAAPAEVLPKALPLLVNALCQPPMEAVIVEREKALMRLEALANHDDPLWAIKAMLEARLFEGTSHAHPPGGWLDTIPRLTAGDARHFHRQHFIAPNFALIAIVPDAAMLPALTNALPTLPQGQTSEQVNRDRHAPSPAPTMSLRSDEAIWGIGWRVKVKADDAVAWDALTLHLRTVVAPAVFKQVGATEEWSVIANPVRGELALSVVARLRPFTDAPERLLRRAMKQLAEQPLGDEEMVMLRSQLLLRYHQETATPLDLAYRIGWAWALHDDPSLTSRYEQSVEELTSKQLQTVTRHLVETPPISLTFQAR